jgi:hypothetical protein
MKRLAFVFLIGIGSGSAAFADPIRQACLKTDRGAGNGHLCGCIQHAANLTLSAKDQRLAATFFADPHRAQQVRQSGRKSDEKFWKRYKNFGATAESICR